MASFQVYFENIICSWLGFGMGEKQESRMILKLFGLSNWMNENVCTET